MHIHSPYRQKTAYIYISCLKEFWLVCTNSMISPIIVILPKYTKTSFQFFWSWWQDNAQELAGSAYLRTKIVLCSRYCLKRKSRGWNTDISLNVQPISLMIFDLWLQCGFYRIAFLLRVSYLLRFSQYGYRSLLHTFFPLLSDSDKFYSSKKI